MRAFKDGDLISPIYNLSGFVHLLTKLDEDKKELFPIIGSNYEVREFSPFRQTVILKEFKGRQHMLAGEYAFPADYFVDYTESYDYLARANINIRRPDVAEILDKYIYKTPKREGFFKPRHPRLIMPYKEKFFEESQRKERSKEFQELSLEYGAIFKLSFKMLHLRILQYFSLEDCIKMLKYSISNNLNWPSLDDGKNLYNIYVASGLE